MFCFCSNSNIYDIIYIIWGVGNWEFGNLGIEESGDLGIWEF